MSRGTLGKVQNGIWDPWGGPGRFVRLLGRSGMGRGPSGRSWTGWEILEVVWDGLKDP